MLVTPFMSAGHESEDVAAFAVAESSASLCHGGCRAISKAHHSARAVQRQQDFVLS